MPPSKTLAGQREAKFLEQYTKDKAMFAALREHKIFGLRRALWVTPTKSNATYSGDDLHVSFSLPSGAYASIVFDQLHAELVSK